MATAITPVTFRTAASPAVEHSELPKLLIVESDRLVREACREAASSLGWHPTATDSIEHALWFLGSTRDERCSSRLEHPQTLWI